MSERRAGANECCSSRLDTTADGGCGPFLRNRTRNSVVTLPVVCTTLPTMKEDREAPDAVHPSLQPSAAALALLCSDIRKLFPPGPKRERWRAWARQLERGSALATPGKYSQLGFHLGTFQACQHRRHQAGIRRAGGPNCGW